MPRLAKVERKIEYFPCISEIKEVNDAKYQIGGYLNYKNNIDFGDDRTMNGAFRKTLQDAYSRKAAQGLDFLWPYLWNHDYSILPPGGIFDGDEDKQGLYVKVQFNPDIQMGRELFSNFKMGISKKQSMGYKAIQVEYVKDGKLQEMELGYKVNRAEFVKENGRTIRNLLEVQVMEGSAVVFPMNDLAQVDTVKNQLWTPRYWPGFSAKSVCGKTTWPLMDKDTAWDGDKAKKQIKAWASKDDGSLDVAKMKSVHFWFDPEKQDEITGYKLAFCYIVDGSPKAVPRAIFEKAGLFAGARGGLNVPESDMPGLKAKVAAYYKKLDMKPPWEKGRTMDIWNKDYAESYMQTNQQDWVSDLWNLWYPLRNEIITAFQTGDTPVEDVQKALDQFSAATIAYMQQGIALDMTEYLQPDDENGPMPMYMMSSDDNPETKDAKKLSAQSHAKLMKSVDGAIAHMKEAKSELSRQRANALQGYQVYGDDKPIPEQKIDDKPPEDEDEDEATQLNKLRSMVDDLAATLQFENAYKGV